MSGYEHEHEHGHFMPHSHSHRHQGEQPTKAHERSGMGPHHHTHAALTRREPLDVEVLARAIGDSGAEASADVDAALLAIERAEKAVDDLCQGRLRWEMRVPAEPDHDPDLIISDALRLARAAIRECETAEGRLLDEALSTLRAGTRADALGLERLLDMATDDDVLYDHPVAQSGEPMDPVLFVRWDFIRAALADRDAT